MTSGRLKCFLATVLTSSLLALPSSATASSRFVIDHASPVRARVQLDFTIIIPETLMIGSGLGTADVRSSPQDDSLNISGASHNFPKLSSNGSVVIVGNSGTLAFGPDPHTSSLQLPQQATRSDQAENLPVNYLVAMP